MRRLRCRRGTFTFEYAVVIICIVAALIAMQIYLTRGFQGRFKQTADSIGEQYAPGSTTSDILQTFNSASTTVTNTTDRAGITSSTAVSNSTDTQTRTGKETVGPLR